jgi:YVTN family beta-propeller protein
LYALDIERRVVVLAALVVVLIGAIAFGAVMDGRASDDADAVTLRSVPTSFVAGDATTTVVPASNSTTTTTTTLPPVAPPDGKTSDQRVLTHVQTVRNDDLQPKSIVHSGSGLFFAQNMMYRHNVAVFDRAGNEVARIDDTVDLAAFGVGSVVAQGSPVEVAFSPDARYAYVSNYKMFGPGFNPVADDECLRWNWDESFVYRIDISTFEIDQVIPVGAVPKYLAISPDGRWLVVSNWCSHDVSVVDLSTGREARRIEVGLHPRGIAIRSDSRRAYVSVMGEARIVSIDLQSFVVGEVPNAGGSPRHLVLSPDDSTLYVSNNLQGQVRKIDLATGTVAGVVATGTQPRTMVLADDGRSLYVVNYRDDILSKVRTSDMTVVQRIATGTRPVGVTYDPATRRVWVANYAGSLSIYQDE